MLRKLKNLCLRLTIDWLDGPVLYEKHSDKDAELIRQWMADSYAHPGYQKFFEYRHAKFVKELAAFGMEDQPRDNYIRKIGQRFEILRWNKLMGDVFNLRSKKFKEKMAAEEAAKEKTEHSTI